ncbi:MAG: DUF4258 domain-containing protein [Chloroflexi bacterium]|nr:DUF4258 domain-containing protein [Chloroflexota bacterium]
MNERLIFRIHAVRRMVERRISEDAIRHVLETGEVIENYPDDKPFPSSLQMGWYESRAIHVVVARDDVEQKAIIITAYEPDVAQWQPDFKRRKS